MIGIELRHRVGTRASAVCAALVTLFVLAAAPQALAQQAGSGVTFAKDVAPIFQKNCQQCHQPGAIGPMSLTTYEEVRPWARSIRVKVLQGEMPPYRYDRNVGIQELKHDLRLSEADIRTVVSWVDAGAPLGDRAQLPPAVQFPDPTKWAFADQFGPPDLVIKSDPFSLPARGQDTWWRPIVPVGIPQNRCVKAIAVKPHSRAAAHHANSDLLILDEKTGEYVERERISEYAQGKVGEIVPADSCRTLPAGSLIKWDIHYFPMGEPVTNDVVEMGIWFYPQDHQAKANYKQDLKSYSLLMKGGELEIAPNSTAMTQGFHSFKTPVRIDSFQPHGHARLVGMTLEVFYPETGKLEMVSSVSNWTNAWHTSHIYEDDAAPLLPKGAIMILTGYYDNTSANKGNPDPDQWVGGGSRTGDEMSHGWIAVTHLDDAGYAKLVAEREARKKATTQNQGNQQ